MVVSKEGRRRRRVADPSPSPADSNAAPANTSVTTNSTTPPERELSPPEIPKRPKVHAQRKFAQGQGTTSSAYLNSYSSAPPTPAKDAAGRPNANGGNGTALAPGSSSTSGLAGGIGAPGIPDGVATTQQMTELLPNKRPNTEDFLTFVCFHRTSALPPALDFFNKSASSTGSAAAAAATGGRGTSSAGATGSSSKVAAAAKRKEEKTPPSANKEVVTTKGGPSSPPPPASSSSAAAPVTPAPSTYMPFAVRKRATEPPVAELRSDRKQRSQDKVQALRKKYRDQRVAKLRATTGNTRSGVRGGAATTKTRSAASRERESTEEGEDTGEEAAEEEVEAEEEEEVDAEEQKDNKKAKESVKASRKGSTTKQKSKDSDPEADGAEDDEAEDKQQTGAKRKSGLRSGNSTAQSLTQPKANSKVTKKAEGVTTDGKDTPRKDQPALEEGKGKKSVKKEESVTEESPKGAKKGGKGEEADGGKRTTRLSALRNPTKTAKESSSEDDEPLSRTVPSSDIDKRSPVELDLGKTTRSGRSRKSDPTGGATAANRSEKKDAGETQDKKLRRSVSVLSRRSDVSSQPNDTGGGTSSSAKNVRRGEPRAKQQRTATECAVGDEMNHEPKEEPSTEPSSSPTAASGRKQPAGARKKRETAAKKAANTPTIPEPAESRELTENEKRPNTVVSSATTTPVELQQSSGRPSRKTKEAATLYMELIGRKFNQDDKSDDDDASSLDSLELPNVRRLEQMENELKKANAGKKETKATAVTSTVATKNTKSKQTAAGEETKNRRKTGEALASKGDTGVDEAVGKKLEKSFSDSDEEPLATKFQRKKQTPQRQPTAPVGAKGKGGNAATAAAAAAGGGSGSKSTKSAESKKEEPTRQNQAEPPTTPSTGQRAKRSTGLASSPAKQNGTTPPFSSTATGAGSAMKTPVKTASSRGVTNNSNQNSPAATQPLLNTTQDPLRTPESSSTRLNRSADNNTTFQSTIVEASESPTKVVHPTLPTPPLLNIPTVPVPLSRTEPPPGSPFTRQMVKPSELIVPSGQLKSSPPGTLAGIGFTPEIPFNRTTGKSAELIALSSTDFMKSFEEHAASEAAKAATSSLLGNLLPSKEESEKIFGIASVSLAQSSGPLDTKCTLGKCGSVHKPPLGPPVLTESLLGGHLSPRDRRKAKVNMTHEQIQRWIDESSWSPIEDDLREEPEISSASMSRTPPPPGQAAWDRLTASESNNLNVPTVVSTPVTTPTTSALVTSTPITSTPVTTTGTGEAVNYTKASATTMITQSSPQIVTVGGGTIAPKPTSELLAPKAGAIASPPVATGARGGGKGNERESPLVTTTTPVGGETSETNVISTTVSSGKREAKETENQRKKLKPNPPAATTNASQTPAKSQSPATTPTDRKPIYRTATGRTPVYKQQQAQQQQQQQQQPQQQQDLTAAAKYQPSQQATGSATQANQHQSPPTANATTAKVATGTSQTAAMAASAASNKFGAFSPVNEPSVYSFDNEEQFMPVATPFRRQHGRRESCNSSARDEPVGATTSIKREPANTVAATEESKATAGGGTVGDSGFQKPPLVSTAAAGASTKGQPAASVQATTTDNRKAIDTGRASRSSATVAVQDDTDKLSKTSTGTGRSREGTGTGVKLEPEAPTDDSEADGQTFYIPLQGPTATGAAGSKPDQLIQGVAVKLGTEGPDGPNQRVIMHAKLVTKAEMGTNPTTLPESMNVQELVKSLTAQVGLAGTGAALSKDAGIISKLMPSGTIGQPRFKATEGGTSTTAMEQRSEGRSSVEPVPRPGGLSRINSNSSLSSSQRSKPTTGKAMAATAAVKQQQPQQQTQTNLPQADNSTTFPRRDDPAQMVEAPVFRPSEKEFQDPLEYIERIAPVASRFGICRIIPPASFKPECRIADDMRFMAYNQYVHKMLHRWGPSAKEYAAIKKYLATQSINLQSPPVIGGMEVDLPRLYHTVQELGGLKEVIEKKRWARVAEDMCIPKAAHDRVSKLDDIYCKYLLPYDTLSHGERQKLFDEVEADWAKREAKARRNADKGVGSDIRTSGESDDDEEGESNEDDDEEDEDECTMECIVKGRNMPLKEFFRIARNTMSLWFRSGEPTVQEIEAEYWRHVAVRDSHVCVHSGSIDSSALGFGFPSPKVKGSSCAKHPWNLKVLTNNNGSILRSLGPVMGITIPTLHVGMLFSACCWYRDPHGLPWIEYLHTGANKIWYGVPDEQNANFRAALTVLVPTHCQNKTIWLPCDTAMVPPHMLTDRSVSLCRTEQQPGQFVVVFPRAYTSSLCTGYAVSESVYFATNSWLDTAKEDFRDIQESCEPTMFSVEQLLFAIANDQRSNPDTLAQAYPMIVDFYEKEKQQRQALKDQGVTQSEKIESKKKTVSLDEFECETCRANLYLSLVKVKVTADEDDKVDEAGGSNSADEEEEERLYCLKHAIKYLADGQLQTKHCRLAYTYSLEEIDEVLKRLQERIANRKSTKSNVGGSSGAGGGGGSSGVGGGVGGSTSGGAGRGKSTLNLASTSSHSSSSYQAPTHSKFSGMATMLK
uniref:Putative small domain found in the jumonji family of transcription factors n=1 Tax=Anopheles marajoara TaxID=58244 RepID=A0A2M4B810_9DIPT